MQTHPLSIRLLRSNVARESAWVWHVGSWVIALAIGLMSQRWAPTCVFAILFLISQFVAAWLPAKPVDARTARSIQAFALFVTMSAMMFSSLLFYANLGTSLGANDEAKIHFWVLDSAEDLRDGRGLRWSGDWPGHAVPLILLHTVVTLSSPITVDIHDFAFLEKMYTVFWASWTPVVIYFALRRCLSAKLSYKSAIALALFPAMLFYGSIAVRDALVTFNYTLFFYLLSSKSRTPWNVAFRIVLLAYTYVIRNESAAFLAVAWVGYEGYMACYFGMRSHAGWITPFCTALVVCITCLVAVNVDGIVSQVGDLHQQYGETTVETSSDESLGMRIRGLPQPAPPIVFAAIGGGGLIPPQKLLASPYIEEGTVDGRLDASPRWSWSPGRILKASGPLAWQVCLPFMWIGYRRRHQLFHGYPEFFAVVAVSFAYMAIIPQFTIDLGKLSAGYPFPLALAFVAFYTSSSQARGKAFLVLGCWLLSLTTIYFYMKMI